jgi:pimeloyl-ACP methyl ester carboxylesterase
MTREEFSMPRPTVVFVHGAFGGSWCWTRVSQHLARSGVVSIALDLPGHGNNDAPAGTLARDAAYVREVVATITEPVLLVGYSYGGTVVTEAASVEDGVVHCLYVAGFQLEAGEHFSSHIKPRADEEPGPATTSPGGVELARRDGDIGYPSEASVRDKIFFDCSAADTAWALEQLEPEHMSKMTEPVTRAGWSEMTSTYVVCAEDRLIDARAQRLMARRATRHVELASGHSPFLRCPVALADAITDACVATAEQAG